MRTEQEYTFKSVRNSVRIKTKPLENQGVLVLLAVGTGLEPATPCVTGMYSNQLNYPTNILLKELVLLTGVQK